ncbi:MAG: cupin domain-containing protein [Planctomycetia bacterium]|nr:cupin domain-containing protein [Planctomycetia bacterium]
MPDNPPFLPHSELAAPIVHPPGSGKMVTVLGDESIFKVLPEETGGAYALLEQRIPAGHGPPLHVHRHETEIFYILEGAFELTIGERKVAAPPGTMLAGPRDVPHTFRNAGTTEGRLLLWVIPGRFANFFKEVDAVSFGDLAAIKALAAKYGVEILV